MHEQLQGIVKCEEDAEALAQFARDAIEYLGLSGQKIIIKAQGYVKRNFPNFKEGIEYYRGVGDDQVCRQVWFRCSTPNGVRGVVDVWTYLRGSGRRILDYGCGSSAAGLELARRGNDLTFVDIDGAGGFEFLKWRAVKHGVTNCTFYHGPDFLRSSKPIEPFDTILMMDFVEHVSDYDRIMNTVLPLLKDGGLFINNFFSISDVWNVEHVFMNKPEFAEYLNSKGLSPINMGVWIKNPPEWLGNITNLSYQKSLEGLIEDQENNNGK